MSAAHPGPPLGAPAVAFAATTVAAVAVSAGSPSPFGGDPTWYAGHTTATAVGSWLLLLAALFLVVFAGIAVSRLRFLAPNAPGPTLAAAGGLAAAALLGVSAAAGWATSRADVAADPRLASALHDVGFVAGGPAHTAALGVLVLGLAVTTLFLRRTPRPLSLVGFGVAAVDLLSSIALVVGGAAPLVAVGRFGSLVWIVAVAVLVPRERGPRG